MRKGAHKQMLDQGAPPPLSLQGARFWQYPPLNPPGAPGIWSILSSFCQKRDARESSSRQAYKMLDYTSRCKGTAQGGSGQRLPPGGLGAHIGHYPPPNPSVAPGILMILSTFCQKRYVP